VTALVLATFPIAFLIFAAIAGIPLWLTFKRPDQAPRYALATASTAQAAPGRAAGGLSTARQHAAAARTPLPGRAHAVPARPARSHTTQPHPDRIPA